MLQPSMAFSFITNPLRKFAAGALGIPSPTDPFWFRPAGAYIPTQSGVTVSGESGLRVSIAFACMNAICNSFVSIRPILYRREANNQKSRATDHPLYKVLSMRANPRMPAGVWRKFCKMNEQIHGNAYSEIQRDGAGRIVALWPIPAGIVKIERLDNGDIVYRFTIQGKDYVLPESSILHTYEMTLDGINGIGPIDNAREALGLTAAAEGFGARFYSNNAQPGGVLKHPGKLSEPAAKMLKDQWESKFGGVEKAHRIAVLEEGMEFSPMSIHPDQAQFLETRKFQAEEVCRFFNMKQHKVGILEHATFSNIEHQSIEYLTDTILPLASLWEEMFTVKLLSEEEQDRYFIEFQLERILRADSAAQAALFAAGRQWGWFSINDVRDMLNWNRIENGDDYLSPINMQTVDQLKAGPIQGVRVPVTAKNGSNGHAN